jgi:hypothetical protein
MRPGVRSFRCSKTTSSFDVLHFDGFESRTVPSDFQTKRVAGRKFKKYCSTSGTCGRSVRAHATTVTTARAKTQARPTWRDVRSATSEKSLVRSGRLRSVLALHSAGLVAGLFVIAFFIVPEQSQRRPRRSRCKLRSWCLVPLTFAFRYLRGVGTDRARRVTHRPSSLSAAGLFPSAAPAARHAFPMLLCDFKKEPPARPGEASRE